MSAMRGRCASGRPLGLTERAWFEALGEAARAIGSDEFHARILHLYGSAIRHDMAMIVRYSRFSAPDFLICEGLPRHLVELYRSGYYRYDPFYGYWQSREHGGVVSLREVSPPELWKSHYRRVFQRQAQIADELGMFLPGVGRASIALFLERSVGRFSPQEIERARRIYPAVAGLYRAHVARIFAGLGATGAKWQPPRPTLLIDSAGERVYANRSWREAEAADPSIAAAVARLATGAAPKQVALPGERMLHAEPLEADFPLAPAGRMYVIESVGLAPARPPLPELPPALAAELTHRERQIVSLILEGYPSAVIAKRLRISPGTVKNHRRRLYYKLDITSERELFLLYLRSLGAAGQAGAERRPEQADAAQQGEAR